MQLRSYSFILTFIAVSLLFSCSTGTNKNEDEKVKIEATPDSKFEKYKVNFIDRLWRMNPDWASSQGFHLYDSVLVVNSEKRRLAVRKTYHNMLRELSSHELKSLSANNQIDHRLMENFARFSIWQDSVLKIHEWDPSQYNMAGPVAEILNGRYAPLNTRLLAISSKLIRATVYYETAINNLKKPTLEHTQLAILQNKGGISVFGNALLDSVEKSNLKPEEKDLLRQRIQNTKLAITGFVHHLETYTLPQAKKKNARNFRIGKALFEEKFKYEIQSQYSAGEIFKIAQDHKKELQWNMINISRKLWPKYFTTEPPADSLEMVKKMISRISEKHTSPDSFIIAIRRQIPELVKFVNDKNLLTQDPSRPLVVRETPLYMRGSGAGASVSAPGPYDQKADTYYNVTPLDDYTPKEAESYLREYNKYTLQILNIHEAIPGHYTQLVYANKAPSIIKTILGNGAMVEGWAVYTEKMMLENGYQNSPEMWLMYYKWNLRTTLNTIIDYGIHASGYSEKQVMDLLLREGFQEEAEAKGKWTRAKLSQVQLSSYFTGYTEIYNLREELKKKQGRNFNLKKFHEQFLSYGSAPVKYIRQLMLSEK
jgi:uncharacterized protein (DUF885 family)